MATQTKYQKDLQDGKIKPKPVVAPAKVVNTVRTPLPAAPKAPAGNPYQNIYATPKAPVYSSDRGADRIKALAPAPVKYTPQNLPVYRGAAPAVQPQPLLVKPQGGKTGGASVLTDQMKAQMYGTSPAPATGGTIPPSGGYGAGNYGGEKVFGSGNAAVTNPPPPKKFDFVTSTTPQVYNYMISLYGVKGKEEEFKIAEQQYNFRIAEDARRAAAAQNTPAAALYNQTQAGVTANQAHEIALQTAAASQTAAAAQQAQVYAMAQLNANNAAAERMAQMQYAQTPPVDRTEYNQMVDMYQALQQQMMTLQNSYIQALRDRDIPVVAPVVPPPVTGPTPFVPPSFAPSPQTGAYAEFSDTGLGALNTMNPSNLQVLRQLMQARGYTGAGSQGRYGERTYARPGGSGALGISDADFENPLNYAGVAAADRENAEAAMRWFLGQSGYSPQYAFPGMPSYPGGGTFIDLPRIS